MIPFLPPLRMSWVVYALLGGLLVGYVKGCTDEKQRFASFKAAVTAVGQAQEDRTRARVARDKQRKKESDNENLKLRADYQLLAGRLRERARAGVLPERPAPAGRPAAIAFNWDDLDRALRDLDTGVRGLVEEGDQDRIDLDTARRWAQQPKE